MAALAIAGVHVDSALPQSRNVAGDAHAELDPSHGGPTRWMAPSSWRSAVGIWRARPGPLPHHGYGAGTQ